MSADLDLLLGDEADDLLSVAVGSSGATLHDVRPLHVDHRPGSMTTVSYAGRVTEGGQDREETLAASITVPRADESAGQVPTEHPGTVSVSDGDRTVTVWRMPDDPDLPGLRAACDVDAVGALLESFALNTTDLVLLQHVYRPRRRAVIEARAAGGSVFIKVLRPSKVEHAHQRHTLLSAGGLPTPRSLGWTNDGVLVLEALRGIPLRQHIVRAQCVPDGDAIVAFLDRMPRAAMDLPRRAAWSEHAHHYAEQISTVLPAASERVGAAADTITQELSALPDEDPVHGDFYEHQILITGGDISGLLDVDSTGPGRRADDLACLVAHLLVLEQMGLVGSPERERLLQRWMPAFDARVDPSELRLRIAGVLLTLATGPHRVQEAAWVDATWARLDLVDAWIEKSRSGSV